MKFDMMPGVASLAGKKFGIVLFEIPKYQQTKNSPHFAKAHCGQKGIGILLVSYKMVQEILRFT